MTRAGRAAARLLRGRPTALLVPVHGLPLEAPATPGLPHHVTVVFPFVRARAARRRLRRALQETFGEHPAFDFALTSVGRFPGVVYLAPTPAQPFVALTEAAVRRWPRHRPYGGAFAETVPHLTLVDHGPEPAGLLDRVQPLLPIAARAEEVWLMVQDRRGWRRLAVVRLAPPTAPAT